MAEQIASSIAGKVADSLFDAARRELGYLFHYNDNVKNLKKQATKLAASRDMVQKKIEFAERNGEIIFANVQSWIAEVDNVSAKAESFLEDEDKANKRCLKGCCINLKQRYRFSKEAKKHTLVISDQLQEVGKFERVSCPAPPSGVISSSKVFYSGPFESRNSIKKQVMNALIDSDRVSIIGICGMGGVGKTTLVKEISQHVKEAKMYDAVVMAVVSQTPSLMKIQGEIADMLGVTNSLPANSEIARAGFLWDRIKEKKRILIILDDVWERIKLDEIGIRFGSDHRGCKIVITSRSKTVCNQMECQEIFTVETLSQQESWVLFSEIVGSNVETSVKNSIAREIAAKCGGLPIAIVTIAGTLKSKNKHVWSNAARQLQKSNPSDIPGVERILFSSLELSLNYLEKVESKSLFLFCSLFPDDYKIPIEVLVRYAIGQRWFNDVDETIEGVRDRVHAIVSTITSSFLLIDDGEYVKMHDVVRDFALNIARKYNHQFMVKTDIGLQEWTNRDTSEDFTCISLMSNNTMELPNELDCPKLQVLMLQGRSEIFFPRNFFQGMKNLNVLDFSGFTLLSLPDSLSFLSNLRTLFICGCKLGDIGVIGNLRKLEILSLTKSSIKEISVSFSQLTNLKLLDLNDCRELTLIPYGVIHSLKKLEELYINKFWQWECESEDLKSNANLVELEVLSRLTHLEISISNLDLSPKLLVFQNNMSNFKLRIGYNEYSEDYLDTSGSYLRNMHVSKTNISNMHDWVKCLLKRTECLVLEKIANLESINHNLVEEGFNELMCLRITSCDEIKYLLNTLEWTPNSTFHNLEKLFIYENPNLVELCHGQPPAQSFSKLEALEVIRCCNMLNVVPSHLLQNFQNFQTFTAKECRSLVYIFDCDEIKIAEGETKLLSSLEYLYLKRLPELSHIWKGEHQSISLQNLQTLNLLSCNKLTELFSPTLHQSLICLEEIDIRFCNNLEEIFEKKEDFDEELQHSITSPILGNLTSIYIVGCNKLKYLFTPSIVKCLVKLKSLQLWFCSTIQEIVTNEKGEKEEPIERIVFPSLYYLNLLGLRNLTCFSSGSYTIEFPRLESLRIRGCQKMKTFGYGEQVTPKLNKVSHENYGELWNDNLNATVQALFREEANQPEFPFDVQTEEDFRDFERRDNMDVLAIATGMAAIGVSAGVAAAGVAAMLLPCIIM